MNESNRPNLLGSIDLFLQPSEIVDRLLGFDIVSIEEKLLGEARKLRPTGSTRTWGEGMHQGNQSWVGLDPQTLLTPYKELQRMCELLEPKPSQTFVDLGTGYGRMGLVLHQLFPQVNFLGYELVKERVTEGSRILSSFQCHRAKLYEQDLCSHEFELPMADYYFIYDYGKVSHIRRTLQQLSRIADTKNFKVVARGKGSRSLIENEHPWLSDVYPVLAEDKFSIYSMSHQGSPV